MTAADDTLCRHCLLPIGRRAMRRTVNGESCAFCCYGCCLAHQVKSGSREEHEAAWLLVRIGVGSFLSMNIMLFSLLLYTDAFGVRPVLEEMARELAEHGYYVLVPNLYYRHGPAPVIELPEHIGEDIRPAIFAQLMPLIEEHTTERILREATEVKVCDQTAYVWQQGYVGPVYTTALNLIILQLENAYLPIYQR